MATTVIAVANQKGGVGKTTTTVNVAACLAAVGKNVLLLDLDPQANATSGVGVEKKEGGSAYRPLLGEGGLTDKIQSTAFSRLQIIPGEVDMCGAEIEMARAENHLQRLSGLLRPLVEKGNQDLILIDCPPSLGILTLNAFAASDYLLIPLQCEYFALEGISMSHRVLKQVQENGINPRLSLLGVVMTMFDARTNLSAQVTHDVREHYGAAVFQTVIPRATRLAEAPSFGKPIIHYDRTSTGATAYDLLTGELLRRLSQRSRASG